MAKKEKEEEKKEIDPKTEEDFGLPDLEFEELDDIDEEEFDEADLENVEEEIAELIGETSDDELALDDIGVEDEEGEEVKPAEVESEDKSLSDIGASSESEIGEELGETSSLEEELQKETIDEELDEVEKFISEITADDVEEDTQEAHIESEPVESHISSEVEAEASSYDDEPPVYSSPTSTTSDGGDTAKSFTRIIIFGLVGAVALAFAFLYWHNQSKDDGPIAGAESETPAQQPAQEEPAQTEPAQEEPAETPPATTQQPTQTTPTTTRPATSRPQPAASTGTPGEVTVINSRANRYYIVVASFIDEDMANDLGSELAGQGVAVKIVHPFNERRYFRVAVADYGSRDEAVRARETFTSQYGNDIWALKY